jgi:uncharacterized protein (TIGR02996 family)
MELHEAFLRFVTSARDDDTPRLLFADWLASRGSTLRAAFVRAQLAAAKAMHAADWEDSDEYQEAKRVVGSVDDSLLWTWAKEDGLPAPSSYIQLQQEHGDDWEYLRITDHDFSIAYHRGFVTSLTCPELYWLDHGPLLCRRLPLRHVELHGLWPSQNANGGWSWHLRTAAGSGGYAHSLTEPVFRCLLGRRGRAAVYLTQEEADDALSRACLAYGRRNRRAAQISDPSRGEPPSPADRSPASNS